MLRALKITAALASLGALAGAIGGALAPVIGYTIISVPFPERDWWVPILWASASFGAGCGVIAAPVVWWTALRAIPVWRGGIETGLATSFAGSFAIGITSWNPYSVFALAVVGAALAAVRLRWEFLGD